MGRQTVVVSLQIEKGGGLEKTMRRRGEGVSARPVEDVARALRKAETEAGDLRKELAQSIRYEHLGGKTYKEIAAIVGRDVATVWRYANDDKWEGSE